jgi:hypothetical protein
MTNVIKLRRTDEDLKERMIEQVNEDKNYYHMLITFPKDADDPEGRTMFYSNFESGHRELFAIEMVQQFMLGQLYTVEEE